VSTKYLLPCSCGDRIAVDAAQAGQRVRCSCGAELEVPTLMGLRKLEPSVATPQGPRRNPIAWGPRQALMLLGAIIVILGASWAAWCLASRPRFVFDRLAPLDALSLWELLKSGVDAPPAQIERWMAASREYGNLWAGVGWAAAAIGALIFAASFAIPGPSRKSRRMPDL